MAVEIQEIRERIRKEREKTTVLGNLVNLAHPMQMQVPHSTWILDSGASRHVTVNLVSISSLVDHMDCWVTLDRENCLIEERRTGRKLGIGIRQNGLWYLDRSGTNKALCSALAVGTSEEEARLILQHCRLGHMCFETMRKIYPDEMSKVDRSKLVCDACEYGKHTRATYISRGLRSISPFMLIHSDVWTSPIVSVSGMKYFVTFIDCYSRMTWIYLMKHKNEVLKCFKDFYAFVRNQFNTCVKIIRTDNGKEYVNNEFGSFLSIEGILHQTSCPDTPPQNGVAEKKNRHILEVARSLMYTMNVPKFLWSEAVMTATYLINRTPSRILGMKAPYEMVFGCNEFIVPPKNWRKPHEEENLQVYTRRKPRSLETQQVEQQPLTIDRNEMVEQHQQPLVIDEINDQSSYQSDPIQENTETGGEESEISGEESNLPIANRKGIRSTAGKPPIRYGFEEVEEENGNDIANYVSYSSLSPAYRAFIASFQSIVIPKDWREAKNDPKWHEAMMEEMSALEKNKTWELVPFPTGKKVVSCKWVNAVKQDPFGKVERYKARLVAKGYSQTYGIDYDETFAPVAKMSTVRTLISCAANFDWPLYQLDVKNAFLHGDLQEEVYMEIPPGFSTSQTKGKVLRLKKSLYGLKQSPRAWFDRFRRAMCGMGYKQCNGDHTLFYRHRGKKIAILAVYVDDIIITGDDTQEIAQLKENISKEFEVKDLGQLKYFLGIEIARSPRGIVLSQRKYVLDLLCDTGMLGCRPASTPIEQNHKLCAELGDPVNKERYQRLVGRLIYLCHTRPDITYAVSVVSRYMHDPRSGHMDAVYRILRYLKGSPGKGLWFKKNGHLGVEGYCDADWASSLDDRRSTSGYCVFVGGNLVSWRSKKQPVVSRSTAEAEYRAMSGCICRINNCAVELFSMEEDLVIDDEDSWDLLARDLRLKATFLYIDLGRVICSCEIDEHKKMLTGLANKFFYFMDELTNAVSSRSIPLMQVTNKPITYFGNPSHGAKGASKWLRMAGAEKRHTV
uniref:OSJNBb0065J09.3 protein n=1 Tax=Oryza sativa subsp. japonica TaxID=39947 RepID=Q7XKG6_ORYSJ|nr:OSJNBb0065J09.3 [Oryza sativa Japonica Group]